VDAAGQEIQLSHHVPTLKANLRARKRDEMKEHIKDSTAQVFYNVSWTASIRRIFKITFNMYGFTLSTVIIKYFSNIFIRRQGKQVLVEIAVRPIPAFP